MAVLTNGWARQGLCSSRTEGSHSLTRWLLSLSGERLWYAMAPALVSVP